MGALGKILATTDLSDKSGAGLKYAASIARDYGAELHIIHVMSSQDIGDLDLPTHQADHMGADADAAAAANLANHLADVLDEDAGRHKASVVFGSPAMEILKYARQNDCGAIVITISSRSRVGKLLLGSDTLEMLTISEIPVIAVPAGGS